jgi:hypothetical protein
MVRLSIVPFLLIEVDASYGAEGEHSWSLTKSGNEMKRKANEVKIFRCEMLSLADSHVEGCFTTKQRVTQNAQPPKNAFLP